MKFVNPVVDDTERTHDQKRPEMAQLTEMRVECNGLKRLMHVGCMTERDDRTLTFPSPISSATDVSTTHSR